MSFAASQPIVAVYYNFISLLLGSFADVTPSFDVASAVVAIDVVDDLITLVVVVGSIPIAIR